MNCSCSTSSPIESCTTITWPNSEDPPCDIFDLVSSGNCCQFKIPQDNGRNNESDKRILPPQVEFDIMKLAANSIVSKDDIVKLELSKISILSTARNIEWYRVTENGDKEYMETSKASLIEDTGQLKMYLSICEFSPLSSAKRLSCSFIQNETSGGSEYWVFAILIQTRFCKLPSLSSNATCQSTPESLIPLMALALRGCNPRPGQSNEALLNLTSTFKNICQGGTSQGASKAKQSTLANGSRDAGVHGDVKGDAKEEEEEEEDVKDKTDASSSASSLGTSGMFLTSLNSIHSMLDLRLSGIERTLVKMDSRIERLEQLVTSLVEKKPPGCS